MATDALGKILVVDDEAAVRELLSRYLSGTGHEVLAAATAAAAREMAVVNLPDVILTDLRMPGGDGLWLIRTLRRVSALEGTPILVVSGLDDPGSVIEALEAGATDYVTKPLVFEVLRARIAAHMKTKHLHDALRRKRSEMELLFAAVRDAAESSSLDEVLFRITQQLASTMTASRCSILAVDEAFDTATVAASMEDPSACGLRLTLDRYPEVLQAVRTREPVLVDDSNHPRLRAELAHVFRAKHLTAILAVPIAHHGRVLGALTMHVRLGEPAFHAQHVQVVQAVAYAIAGMVHTTQRLEALDGGLFASREAAALA